MNLSNLNYCFASCSSDEFWIVVGILVILSWIGAAMKGGGGRGGGPNVHIHLGGGQDSSNDSSSWGDD